MKEQNGNVQPVTDSLQGVDGGVLLAAFDHADGVDIQVATQGQLFLAESFLYAKMPELGFGMLEQCSTKCTNTTVFFIDCYMHRFLTYMIN